MSDSVSEDSSGPRGSSLCFPDDPVLSTERGPDHMQALAGRGTSMASTTRGEPSSPFASSVPSEWSAAHTAQVEEVQSAAFPRSLFGTRSDSNATTIHSTEVMPSHGPSPSVSCASDWAVSDTTSTRVSIDKDAADLHTFAVDPGEAGKKQLTLPSYSRERMEIDPCDHSNCCDALPPIFEPNSAGADGVEILWNDNDSLSPNSLGVSAAASFTEGDRKYMEDRHRIIYGDVKLLQEGRSRLRACVGVFDGHGGYEAADIAARQLLPKLVQSYYADPHADFPNLISRSFASMEEDLLQQALATGFTSGTTALSVVVLGDRLYCANIGDCRAVLCRDNQPIPLSFDHRPSSEAERRRILQAGGRVAQCQKQRRAFGCCGEVVMQNAGSLRVWPGGLSVSRVLGDVLYKVPLLGRIEEKHARVVIADVDVSVHRIEGGDQFVLLASDGFWDVMSNEMAVQSCLKYVKNKKYDPQVVADKLVQKAYADGGDDNITVVALFFTHHGQSAAESSA